MIAHPPCTYFTTTGARWFYHPEDRHLPPRDRRPHPLFPDRRKHRQEMIDLFMFFANLDAPMVAIENPVGCMSHRYRKPDQIIQPFEYGHDASKATCLWLKGLPRLQPTNIVPVTRRTTSSGKTFSTWYWNTSRKRGAERQAERSRTFAGVASAMADQWSGDWFARCYPMLANLGTIRK